MRLSIKRIMAKLPVPFWLAFYIFLILITIPTLAYLGSFGKAAPGSLTVTVDQKTGTTDPNPSYTSIFTIQFSEPIDKNTFTASDITLGGTAPGQQVSSITEVGTFNKTSYDVRIQASSSGTIIPSLSQELVSAQNGASGTNQASTSTDNSVTYNGNWTPDEFILRVDTDNPGQSASNQYTIPTDSNYTYNYNVDCDNDGTPEFTNQTSSVTCTYSPNGEYDIAITGTFPHFYGSATGDQAKIIDVKQWGDIAWADMSSMFLHASNITSFSATDTPDLSQVTDMNHMFANATNFNSNIDSWDVSNVTDTQGMFSGASLFNQPLNSWDVSNVTTFGSNTGGPDGMFAAAVSFNQPLNNWDVSSGVSFQAMFAGASAFNQNINSWDTSSATNMSSMFSSTKNFNQPLNNWNVSNVTDMTGMFADLSILYDPGANVLSGSSFNQPLDLWNTSNVTIMSGIFLGASEFNQSLANWNVSNVTDMTYMFGDMGGNIPTTSGLSTPNYDATLIAWSQQNLQSNVTFDAGSSQYCTSESQRQSIIDNKSWTINDAGENCPPQRSFIMRVKTDNPGVSGNNQYTIPTHSGDTYSYNVDCNNDGTPEYTNQTGNVTCTYGSPGEYDIAITGTFPHKAGGDDQAKIIDVKQWGDIAWANMAEMFSGATNIAVFTATDTPDLSNVTNMNGMFVGATSFNSSIDDWDVSNVVSMDGMFQFASSFNQPLNSWDTSNVVSTTWMFGGATSFNQPLNNWDVSNLTYSGLMFINDFSFNQPLNNWNVSNVTDMTGMFLGSTSFNQSLASWDVSNVASMQFMFGDYIDLSKFMMEQQLGRPYAQWTQQEKDDFWASASQALGYPVDESYVPNPSGLSTPNYDATLIAWSGQDLESSVVFDAGKSQYCASEAQRQSIIDNKSWTINDAGKNCVVATAPTVPLSLSTSDITTTSLKLNWQAPADDGGSAITSYQVQYKASSSSTWINAPTQGPSPTSHIFTNLDSNTSYDFKVSAINAIGSSPYTSPVSATTLTVSTPPVDPPTPPVTPPTTPPVTPTTPKTPTTPPSPQEPTTDTKTNQPEPGTPVYVPSQYKPPTSSNPQPLTPDTLSTPILGKVIGPLVNVSRRLPKPVAKAMPYSLLTLLLALSALYAYSSILENQRRKAIQLLVNRFKALLSARATYLQITSHYINTPITKMQGVIELLASGITSTSSSTSSGSHTSNSSSSGSSSSSDSSTNSNSDSSSNPNLPPPVAMAVTTTTLTIPETAIIAGKSALKSLTNHSNELLAEGQSLTGKQQANIRNLEKQKGLSFLTHPAFWLPVVVISTLVVLLNVIFIQADRYTPTAITIVSQLLLGFVGTIALGVSYYYYQQHKQQKILSANQQALEQELNSRQASFITQASNKLNDDLLVLEGVAKDIAKYPKVTGFTKGLNDLKQIVAQLEKLNSLGKNVPGLVWKTDLGRTIATSLTNLQPLADKQNITISTTNIEPATMVAVEDQALSHLVSAPIKNAIKASPAGNQVKLNQTTNLKDKDHPITLTITDQGKGIPKDQLQDVFKPFNSAHSLEQFTDTGLGLDLYLCKVICEQYGATINLTSKVDEGTEVVIGLGRG